MADKETSGLTAVTTPMTGAELVKVDQGGNSRKATVTEILAVSTGAMLKADYDPNDDQIIAVAQGGTNSATASGARTNLGLGTMAVQNAATVAITGGTVTGITDLTVADGGTGSSTASGARTNLGLVIGTDVQAWNTNLDGFAATTVTNVQNRVNHTGTQLAATISDFSTAADARVSAAIGVTVQAYDALLASVSALSLTAGDIVYSTGADAVARLGIGADGQVLAVSGGTPAWGTELSVGGLLAANNLSDVASAATARTNISAQESNANLDTLAAVTPGSKGLAILADTTSAAVLTELGGGTAGQAIFADVTKDDVNDYLGVIQNVATNFGAVGDGTANNSTVFGTAKAAGGLVFIPKPATSYNFTTAVGSTDAVSAWLPDPSQTWAQLFDGGQFSLWRGRATGLPTGSNIWRFSDRAFFGAAATMFAGNSLSYPDGGTSGFGTNSVPSYVALNAGVLFMSGPLDTVNLARNQPYGIVSCTRSSDFGGIVSPISFASATVADEPGITVWGGIQEIQRESGAGNAYGWEIAVKNKGAPSTATPNTLALGGPAGAYGIWLHAAGHEDFGGVPTQCTAGITFVSSPGPTIDGSWNTGIGFASDAITNGEAIAMSSEPTIGTGHAIKWYNQAGNVVFQTRSTATDAIPWRLERTNAGLEVYSNGVLVFNVTAPASPANRLFIGATAASGVPSLAAGGTDTNIDILFLPKGTGTVRFGTFTASGDVAVNGYVTIKDAAGNVRKLATIA